MAEVRVFARVTDSKCFKNVLKPKNLDTKNVLVIIVLKVSVY